MRYIKISILGLLLSAGLFCCNKNNNDSGDCTGTTFSATSSGYDNQIKSTIEYYNTKGFLTRSETSFFDSKNDYYETYTYDPENRIIEYFRSYEGYSKYYYEGDNRVKTEIYNLDRILTGYYTYEFSDNVIIDKKKYTLSGPDTTMNYYYHDGYLDSIVSILSNELNTLYEKLEYKYDNNGNKIERIRYSNYERDEVEIISRDFYSYDENSNLITYEPQDNEGNLKLGIYYKYKYDDLGNLIKTEIYNSNDILLDSLMKEYQFCDRIKLIKPEL